jgi:monoterpene epsilon-lactone hydrolase
VSSGQPARQPPGNYQIRVRGHLGPGMLRAFPALHAETQAQDTLLRGTLADQAALYGVLGRIEELGLELLEVRHLSPGSGGMS